MNCKKCGKTIDKASKYCNYCGAKSTNIALIIGISLGVICLALASVILIGKDKIFKSKEKTNEPVKVLSRLERKAVDKSSTWKRYDASEVGKGTVEENFILLDEFVDLDDHLVLRYKNLNDKYVSAAVKTDYLAEDGTIVESNSNSYDRCLPLSDCIITLSAPVNKKSYKSYKINLEVKEYKYPANENDYYKNFTITTSDDGKNIQAKITNNGEKFAYPLVCVAYFLGNELKDAECVSKDIDVGDTVNIKFDNYYFNKKYKGFNFDNYKVFIND